MCQSRCSCSTEHRPHTKKKVSSDPNGKNLSSSLLETMDYELSCVPRNLQRPRQIPCIFWMSSHRVKKVQLRNRPARAQASLATQFSLPGGCTSFRVLMAQQEGLALAFGGNKNSHAIHVSCTYVLQKSMQSICNWTSDFPKDGINNRDPCPCLNCWNFGTQTLAKRFQQGMEITFDICFVGPSSSKVCNFADHVFWSDLPSTFQTPVHCRRCCFLHLQLYKLFIHVDVMMLPEVFWSITYIYTQLLIRWWYSWTIIGPHPLQNKKKCRPYMMAKAPLIH